MSAWVHVAGWVLVHFVWQGSGVALAAAAAWRLYRRGSAHVRYLVGCLALGAMVAAPLVTACLMGTRAQVPRSSSRVELYAPPAGSVAGGLRARDTGTSRADIELLPERYLPVIVICWLAGVGVLLLRAGGSWYQVQRLRRFALECTPSVWQGSAQRLAERLGVIKPVWIVECSPASVPMVVGWLRPVIVLPIAAMAQLSVNQIEAILIHELAHVRRHDYLVNLLQTVIEAVLFYHPAVWWVSARVREEREHCCDDIVVAVSGDRDGYASALAELERHRGVHPVAALAGTDGPLLRRVRRILQVPAPDDVSSPSWTLTLVLVATLTLALGGPHRPPSLLAEARGTVAEALMPHFQSRWSNPAHRGSVESSGTIVFTGDLRDVQSVSNGGFVRVQLEGLLSSQRFEFTGAGGAVRRKYFADGTEQAWSDDAAARLADNLPFLVRRSGVGAEERVRQVAAASGLRGVLDEINLLYTDSVRSAYLRALLNSVPLDAVSSSTVLALAGDRIASSAELSHVLRVALDARLPVGDGFFHALGRVGSSMEKARVLRALLAAGTLGPEVQVRLLNATAAIESNAECAAVLNAFLDGYDPGSQAVRDAFLQALDTVASRAEQRRLLARLGTVPRSPVTQRSST